MGNGPDHLEGPGGNLTQVLVWSGKTFESLFSDSYLSDAGPGIGQQLVWPHRFYCDGGGGESSVASNSKSAPHCASSTSRQEAAQPAPTSSHGE